MPCLVMSMNCWGVTLLRKSVASFALFIDPMVSRYRAYSTCDPLVLDLVVTLVVVSVTTSLPCLYLRLLPSFLGVIDSGVFFGVSLSEITVMSPSLMKVCLDCSIASFSIVLIDLLVDASVVLVTGLVGCCLVGCGCLEGWVSGVSFWGAFSLPFSAGFSAAGS